jgi:hypothetical protein
VISGANFLLDVIPYRHSEAAQILGGRYAALCQAVALTSENDFGTLYRPGCALFAGLGHLKTSEVGDVLEHAVRRIAAHLDRCGLLGTRDEDLDLSGEGDPESNLASSARAAEVPHGAPPPPAVLEIDVGIDWQTALVSLTLGRSKRRGPGHLSAVLESGSASSG